MDINVRDWMVIVGALLIVAVLLDGYRRMRNNSSRVRVALVKVPAGENDDDAPTMHELPNGGARVITRGEEESDSPDTPDSSDSPTDYAADAEPPLLTEPAVERAGETPDLLQGISAGEDDGTAPGQSPAPHIESEMVMLHVIAREEAGFAGDDILQILLACDLRFGQMNFFHRHEQTAGRGPIQFSVANMVQPGVFDIDAMSGFTTSGLAFFLTLPGPADMMHAFDQMLETAECVAENLGGELLDESRSAMTKQTLEHCRQRIRDLERRLLTQTGR